jgi:hypothetical protein
MKQAAKSLGVLFLTLFGTQAAFAQTGSDLRSLQKEIENLKSAQKSIQKDLNAIKKLLLQGQRAQQRGRHALQPFKPVTVSIKDDPFKGGKNSRVTLIDFSDYQ